MYDNENERDHGGGFLSCIIAGIIGGMVVRWLGWTKTIAILILILFLYKNWDRIDRWMHSSDYLLEDPQPVYEER